MSIVITGATGNIGHVLTQKLVDAGAEVAVIARHPEKLDASLREKVAVRQGNLNDAAFVEDATRDADTLFWLTPPDITVADPYTYYQELGEIAAQAIRKNKIERVVFISSVGAQYPKAGQISGLGVQEKLIGDAAPNLYILRCGFFMENFLGQLDTIRNDGAIYAVARPDIAIPVIATKDIAERAAQVILDTTWTGHRIAGLQGPADLTYPQAVEILGEAIGKPVKYVQVTEEQFVGSLLSRGVGEAVARAFGELYASINVPGIVAEPRTPETTTPTTLQEWASAVLKPALA